MESINNTSRDTSLESKDLPALYRAADQNSLSGQRRYMRATLWNLFALILAAVSGAFAWHVDGLHSADVAGIIAAIAFLGAMCIQLWLSFYRPERIWYGGRAAAESAKTLAWRYSVAGSPFGLNKVYPSDVDDLLLRRLEEIVSDSPGSLLTPVEGPSHQITQPMRELRGRPLTDRISAYRDGRIEDQCKWYGEKARWNRKRAFWWSVVLLLIDFAGMIVAVLKAAGVVEVDLLGILGAASAAAISWLQAKQHSSLAEAYSVAASDLSMVKERIRLSQTEEAWAEFVDQAEEAISREHTLWRASRS